MWSKEHDDSLSKLKQTLTTKAFAYFNKDLRCEVTVDASPVGLALVLAQYDTKDPNGTRVIVQYASRTLSNVETRYSQVEKEALAVVWALEKLYLYLYGCEFDVVTDNKAIELIFGNAKSSPKARIERWCLRLLQYKFVIKHQPGAYNIADYLSRNPMSRASLHDHEDIAERYVNLVSNSAIPGALSKFEIAKATAADPVLSQVIKWAQGKVHGNLGAFNSFKDELTLTSDGLLLKGDKLVIPAMLQTKILKIAYQDTKESFEPNSLFASSYGSPASMPR